jgi:hypothetical protein
VHVHRDSLFSATAFLGMALVVARRAQAPQVAQIERQRRELPHWADVIDPARPNAAQ